MSKGLQIGNSTALRVDHLVVKPSYSYPKLRKQSPEGIEQNPNAPNDVLGVRRSAMGLMVGVESETRRLCGISYGLLREYPGFDT